MIVETGIAHGGSLIFYAGLCKVDALSQADLGSWSFMIQILRRFVPSRSTLRIRPREVAHSPGPRKHIWRA